jgi:hypothetical protein
MLVIAVKGSLMPGESARNSFARNFIQRCEIDDLDVADVPRGERRPGDGRNRLLRASNMGKRRSMSRISRLPMSPITVSIRMLAGMW